MSRFLWVAFQLDDLGFDKKCDADIREALKNLPKTLTETFSRVLGRIVAKGNEKIARQIFLWVSAARRPLNLDELREALAIKPCQLFFTEGQLLNRTCMNRITAWCENLVVVDEQERFVQFTHHSVKKFLTQEGLGEQTTLFHFKLERADLEIGESCVTYLNFNDFQKQLFRHRKPQFGITPDEILNSTLGHRSTLMSAVVFLQSAFIKRKPSQNKLDVTEALSTFGGANNDSAADLLGREHPFYKYATANWLLYTSRFEKGVTPTWSLWVYLLNAGQCPGQVSWTPTEFLSHAPPFLQWICEMEHVALLQYIESSGKPFSRDTKKDLLQLAGQQKGNKVSQYFDVLHGHKLREAAKLGDTSTCKELIASGTDVNCSDESSGHTALHNAVEAGHRVLVETLLERGANANAKTMKGETVLHIAALRGNIALTEGLLAWNVQITAKTSTGETARELADRLGHKEIVYIIELSEIAQRRRAIVNLICFLLFFWVIIGLLFQDIISLDANSFSTVGFGFLLMMIILGLTLKWNDD